MVQVHSPRPNLTQGRFKANFKPDYPATKERLENIMEMYERRKFLRIDANFVVSYYAYPGAMDQTDMTLTRNVSLGGICFTSDKYFAQGTILHLTLRFPKVTRLIEALGEVMYVKQEKNKKLLFDIGLKFIQAKEEDLYIIEKVIKECASSGKKIYFGKKKKEKQDEKD